MPADAFTIRAYEDGDEKAILELFARSFPHAPRALRHFEWKYRENPHGNRHISLAFDTSGALVGHYAGYPVPFWANGRSVVAHQVGDTMTHAGIRHVGRGPTSILGRTALHFYERFCEGKVAFNFGFNVANIQKFSLRFLRSDRVEPVAFRVADVPAPLPRSQRWLRGYQLELVRRTNAEWDDLFQRVRAEYRFLVRRDAHWVQWRYLKCPDVRYHVVAVRKWRRLVGWIAYRVEDDRFLWGDALFHPAFPDAVEVALRHVVPAQPQDLSLMCVPFQWTDVVAHMRDELYYSWGDGDLF
jgi:hypothetical protein